MLLNYSGTFAVQGLQLDSNASTGEVCFKCIFLAAGANNATGCLIKYYANQYNGTLNISHDDYQCEELFPPEPDHMHSEDDSTRVHEFNVSVYDMVDDIAYTNTPAYETTAYFSLSHIITLTTEMELSTRHTPPSISSSCEPSSSSLCMPESGEFSLTMPVTHN